MQIIISILAAFAILWTGIFGTMTSVLMQSLSMAVLSACCLLTALHSIYTKDRLFAGIALKPFIFTIICALYFLARALLSDAIDLGVKDLFLVLSGLMIYLLTCYWRRGRMFYRFIIGAVIILALLNFLNFLPHFEKLRDEIIPFAKGNSVTGLFNHRNFMSHYMMMIVLLFLSIFICYRNNKLLKYFCLLLAIIGIFAIYTVKARGGYLGLIAGFFVLSIYINDYYLKNNKSGFFAKFVKIGKVIVLLGVIGLLGKFGKDIYNERSTSNLNATELGDRLHYFSQAIDQIPDAPLFGSGSMSYSYKSYLYWGNLDRNYMDHIWVHNEFIQAFTDYGLIGLLLILGLLALHIWNALKYSLIDTSPSNSSHSVDNFNFLRVAGLCMIIGSSIDMMGSFPAHSYPNIMLMAIACAWMTFKNSEEPMSGESTEPPVNNKLGAKSFSAITFLIFGSISLIIAIPQLKAARIFSQYEIYDDSTNWSAKESMQSGWLPALEQVITVAPTYLRHERLSSLYMELAATKDGMEAESDIEKALFHSEKALDRHPYDMVSIANRASCLFKMKRYKEADQWYELIQKYTVGRQKYFQSFVKRAHNLCLLADDYASAGMIEDARSSYATAFDCCMNSSYNNDQYSRSVISLVLFSRTNFLIKNEIYSELDQMYVDFSGDISIHYKLTSYPELVFTIASAFTNYADLKYSKRKPEIAMKWYFKGASILNNALVDNYRVTSDMKNNLGQHIQARIKHLTDAGITPAK